MHQRERNPRRVERLPGEVDHGDRVLPAAEEQHGALELGRDLAHHVDAFGLELVEVGLVVPRHVWGLPKGQKDSDPGPREPRWGATRSGHEHVPAREFHPLWPIATGPRQVLARVDCGAA